MLSRVVLAGVLTASLAGCFRQDTRTLVVRVPRMASPECAKILQDALARIDGIKSAQPDLEQRTLTVTYDGRKLAIRNIEYLVAGLGFDANDLPAKADAREALPSDCR